MPTANSVCFVLRAIILIDDEGIQNKNGLINVSFKPNIYKILNTKTDDQLTKEIIGLVLRMQVKMRGQAGVQEKIKK